MPQFAIMRCKKLASMGSVAGALRHCYRERETPNADPERTPTNEHAAATSTDQAMGRMRALLPEKRRRDAVLAVEYLMTASPEWWQEASRKQQDEFFRRSRQWLADKYGADRVVTSTIHRDETSPHLSAFVVPLTRDGRLSAREFVGGRQKMRDDQTSYAAAVADLGLSRGIEGSRARHQSIRDYYAALKQPVADLTLSAEDVEPRVLRKGIFSNDIEAPEMVAERLTATVQRAYAPAVEQARQAAQERRRADEARETSETLLKQKNGLQADLERTRRTLAPVIRLQSISPKAFTDVLEQADQRADEIERARERVSERQRAEAEREQRAFLEQAGRDQVVKDFASLAARRQHRFHGFRDGGAKWEATPEPLRALVEGFNAMPKARQERVLQGLRRDPEKNAQIGGLLRERQQNIERGQDRGLSM
jgi:hypothetical protein